MPPTYLLAKFRTSTSTPWVLNISHPYTKPAEVTQAISWMKRGVDDADYTPVTYNNQTQTFVDNQGNTYAPDRGPYTEEAWANFLERLNNA